MSKAGRGLQRHGAAFCREGEGIEEFFNKASPFTYEYMSAGSERAPRGNKYYYATNKSFHQVSLVGVTTAPAGWKFHLALKPTDANYALAWNTIFPILEKYDLPVAKVTRPGVLMRGKQQGKEITIFAYDWVDVSALDEGMRQRLHEFRRTPNKTSDEVSEFLLTLPREAWKNFEPKVWFDALKEMDEALVAAGVEFAEPTKEGELEGVHFTIRNDSDGLMRYVAAREADGFNPLGLDNIYGKIFAEKARWEHVFRLIESREAGVLSCPMDGAPESPTLGLHTERYAETQPADLPSRSP